MKNISEKKTLAESDLEEGEIPEFEVCFGQVKDNLLMPTQTSSQECLNKKSVYFSTDKGGYKLPCIEGEYVSEKPKTVLRNQVPQTTSYDYNVLERRLKYLYPFQATCGSVEHIMTKIGETLGRSNDCHYKGRIFNDPRSLIKLNNNIDAKFRESGSLFRRFRNNYHKKRRFTESNSGSDEDIWKTGGKLKSRNSIAVRRKEEKDFRKKRKAMSTNMDVNVSEAKKSTLFDKSGGSSDDLNKETVKPRGNERLLRAIREIQKREKEAAESHDTPFADDGSNSITSSLVGEKDVGKPVIVSCDTINSNDNQESTNYDDLSEKSFISGEDSDDDVELIKLRLLALTSNKRKSQTFPEEKIKDTEQKIDENSKSGLTDDEKLPEKSPASNDVTESKNSHENDIDSYELMLRAEALKTALLRKHKHRIKKRKCSSSSVSVHHDDRDQKVESPKKGGNELILWDVPETRHEESSFPIVTDKWMPMDTDISIVTISVTNNGTNNEPHMNSENASNLEYSGGDSTDRVDFSKESTGVDHKPNEVYLSDVKAKSSSVKGMNQNAKKSRKRLKKNSKFGIINLNELSIKENSGVNSVTGVEGDKKTKAVSLDSINQKKKVKEHEKKFILVDSSQLSKFQSMCESKLPLNLEQNVKSIPISSKANGAIGATTAAKIPETEIQRIIVHLGSESSDEEVPTQNHANSDNASSKLPENAEAPCTASRDAQSKIVDYEKSVELLLKDARRRIEENMQTAQKIPPTPEAVYNHLAPSQRLEYIKLKQKIAETEKLRKMKENPSLISTSEENLRKSQLKNGQHRGCPTPQIQTKQFPRNKVSGIKSLFSKSNVKEGSVSASKSSNISSNNNNNKKIKSKNDALVVANEVNSDGVNCVIRPQMEGYFRSKNTDLNTKISPKNGTAANSVSVAKKILERKKTLTQNRLHLERLKVLWKNIKMEKMIEAKCLNELKRLKIQQNFFELKVSQQRTKIRKLAEESKQIYEAFQKMNKGLEISGKKKKMLGTEKSGPETADSKIANANGSKKCLSIETGGQMDDVPPPQKKEGNLIEKIDGIINLEDKEHRTMKNSDIASSGTQGEQLKEYNSPLQRHSTESESSSCLKVDPNTIMCQYDLTGRCNDEECPYQHLRC